MSDPASPRTLTLLRHAKSGWDDPAMRDFDRPLNAKGARAAETVGRHLRHRGVAFDHVVASPAQRVRDTLRHLSIGFGNLPEPAWDRRIYLAESDTLLDLIQALPRDRVHVLMVGHNPGLEDLTLLLAADDSAETDGGPRQAVLDKFPTASVAELHFAGDWSAARPGEATLARFTRPRDLDPALGPDRD